MSEHGARHEHGAPQEHGAHHVAGGRAADLPPYPETEEDTGGGGTTRKRRWLPVLAIAIGVALVVLIVLEHALGVRVFGVH